jgi:hypothetical protein
VRPFVLVSRLNLRPAWGGPASNYNGQRDAGIAAGSSAIKRWLPIGRWMGNQVSDIPSA